MELARLSGKVVLSRHHVRTANSTAKTMSGRTSTTDDHNFFVWSNWKAALTINSSQVAELEHTPWARVHLRSFGRVQMGFPNATYVMSVGSSPPQRAGRRRAVRRASLSTSGGTKNASQGRRNKNRPLSRLAAPTAFRHEASNSSSNQQVDWMADKEVIMDD